MQLVFITARPRYSPPVQQQADLQGGIVRELDPEVLTLGPHYWFRTLGVLNNTRMNVLRAFTKYWASCPSVQRWMLLGVLLMHSIIANLDAAMWIRGCAKGSPAGWLLFATFFLSGVCLFFLAQRFAFWAVHRVLIHGPFELYTQHQLQDCAKRVAFVRPIKQIATHWRSNAAALGWTVLCYWFFLTCELSHWPAPLKLVLIAGAAGTNIYCILLCGLAWSWFEIEPEIGFLLNEAAH